MIERIIVSPGVVVVALELWRLQFEHSSKRREYWQRVFDLISVELVLELRVEAVAVVVGAVSELFELLVVFYLQRGFHPKLRRVDTSAAELSSSPNYTEN